MKKRIVMMCGLSAMGFVTSYCAKAAEAVEVINVNCGGHAWEPESTMKGRANPTDRGVAPVAYPGVIWSEGFGWNRTKLKNSEDKPTTVGFHVDTAVGCAQDWRNNKLTLLIGGWHDANKTPLDISGLDKFNRYDLYLPSQDDYGRNKGGEFSISNRSDAGTNTLISTGKNLNGATWVEGEDYVVFKNIVPSDEGGIHVNFTGTLNGFQLVRFDPRKPTTISLKQTVGTNKSTFGDRLTFTATVGGAKPVGKVTFYDGEVPLESQVVNSSSTAVLVTDVFAGGTHPLSARYEGDPNNSPSTSAPISLLVTDNRPATTTTLTLASGSDHPTHGDPVTFTATVAGTKKPSGKVIFYDYEGKEVTPISYYDSRYGKGAALASNDLPPLGAKTLDAALKVEITIKDLPWGRHSITAKYSGDIQNAPSNSAACALNVKARTGNGKLKVFILAGQSNMEGHGAVDWGGNPDTELRTPPIVGGLGALRGMIVNNPIRYDHFVESPHVLTDTGRVKRDTPLPNFVPRNDVWVSLWNQKGEDPAGEVKNGPLTPDFGASTGSVGPEYGFGLTVGDAMDDQVLLIKTAWGGKSLAEDFRPPSSGGKVGPYYGLMTEKVHKVLNNLKDYCPAYQGQGCEIVGFGWHQGWNDRIDTKKTAEYEVNLVNLIKDLRTEFKVPNMRIVIGTTGMSMVDIDPTGMKLIAAQTAVSQPDEYPEFAGTVATVDTRPFDFEENSPSPGGGYHWNYSGESYFRIGVEMGHAMMKMITK
ncbi:MAG: Ig-like domain repeat protein [Verrucomicrobia bacterium]|nr:Ig-like domain repeat protein [Verrucomicrobiota bacterium]